MDRMIVVSVDSHAQMPTSAWPDYLEARYHSLLDDALEENEIYTTVMGALGHGVSEAPESLAVYDTEGAYRDGGYRGVWDVDVRLREMDREGIAAEVVYHGDHRATSLFHNVFNRRYPPDVCDAGMRAYHRWVHDAFGGAADRLLLVGAGGTGADIGALVDELHWLADHHFLGTYAPAFTSHADVPPLSDARWDPVWAVCEERNLPLFVHAGHGTAQGAMFPAVESIHRELQAPGADAASVIRRVLTEVFTQEFFSDLSPRRAMWQLMLGGVFDRFPGLRLVMTEVRADWIPATLRYLDSVYELRRGDVPARHAPSWYWPRNCLATLSFAHRAEVEMRHEIGVDTITFGRDYPHTESTWPNTGAWLGEAFRGVPEDELRLMLGGNAIRWFGLDHDALAAVARRIGPTTHDVMNPDFPIEPALLAHFDQRGGFLKPAEGDRKLPAVADMVQADVAAIGSTPSA